MSTKIRQPAPVSLVLHEDPLSPWCLVAERRIVAALEDLGGVYAPLRHEPFPLRLEPRALTRTEQRRLAGSARRAAREPEAAGTSPDLWLSSDPPLSSLPALAALAAARLQGHSREAGLRAAIREASLVRGLNVGRADVLIELADRTGLDLARFTGALATPATERGVRDAQEEARARGVSDAPSLVIGDEWLLAGARSVDEYRAVLHRYVSGSLGVPPVRTLH